MAHDIFLSYARQDTARILPIVNGLEASGRTVFFDEHVHAGEPWEEVLERELDQASVLLIALTAGAARSRWVRREYTRFDRVRARPMIPLILADVQPPLRLEGLQYVRLTDWRGDPGHAQWQRLLTQLRVHLGEPSVSKAAQAPEQARIGRARERLRLADAIQDPDQPALQRLHWAGRLADLGDARPGVALEPDLVPDLHWADIPTGLCLLAGRPCQVPAFRITRLPITRHQYQAFVRSDDHSDERWWRGAPAWAHRPGTGITAAGDHRRHTEPATGLCWWEATAFCRWLGHRLDMALSLPSVAQWVRAARGHGAHGYPYEGAYRPGSANIDEAIEYPGGNSLRRLVQVGLWPDDTSVFGVQDLIGNAHDWCADEPRPGHRAYRGGCFLSAPRRADIETASSIAADTRVPTIGFRVVAPAAVSADPDGQDRNET